MHTASEGSTVRIFTIRFTGTVGFTIHMFTTLTIHGIHLHGRCRGTGDGVIAGIHLTAVGDMVIRPITAIGTDHIMDGVPLITVRGMAMAVTMEDITIVAGMPILMTIVMAEDHQVPPMYVTETGQAGIWPEPLHAHRPLKVYAKEMQAEQLPKDRMLTAEVHQVQA